MLGRLSAKQSIIDRLVYIVRQSGWLGMEFVSVLSGAGRGLIWVLALEGDSCICEKPQYWGERWNSAIVY